MRVLQLVSQSICACVIALRANVCLAQADVPFELAWEAPRNCPQEPDVQQQLRALVGTSSSAKTRPLQAHGTIEPSDGRYRLTLLIVRNATHGTRIIESNDCKSLTNAATVILALLAQKEKTLGRELSESELSGQPEQAQELPKTRDPTAAEQAPRTEPLEPRSLPPSAESASPWHILLRVPQVTVDFTTLPRAGYGIGLGAGVAYRSWRASVNAKYYATESVTTPGFHPYQLQYRRESLDALGCYGWRWGLVEVAPCAGLTANRVVVHASGAELISRDKSPLWVSIGSGISGYLQLNRHAALVAMGTGQITTNRARFLVETLTGTEQAQRVPLLTFDASLACEWIF